MSSCVSGATPRARQLRPAEPMRAGGIQSPLQLRRALVLGGAAHGILGARRLSDLHQGRRQRVTVGGVPTGPPVCRELARPAERQRPAAGRPGRRPERRARGTVSRPSSSSSPSSSSLVASNAVPITYSASGTTPRNVITAAFAMAHMSKFMADDGVDLVVGEPVEEPGRHDHPRRSPSPAVGERIGRLGLDDAEPHQRQPGRGTSRGHDAPDPVVGRTGHGEVAACRREEWCEAATSSSPPTAPRPIRSRRRR